jgi:hypothetical protein
MLHKMKKILSLITVLFFYNTLFSQNVALVHNGTTTIHNTLDDAYTAAVNDDYIYLPGGIHYITLAPGNYATTPALLKKLHFYGTGIHKDSTLVTGISKVINTGTNSNLYIDPAASGSTFDGIDFSGIRLVSSGYNFSVSTTVSAVFSNCLWGNASSGNIPIDFGIYPTEVLDYTFNNCIINGGVRGPASPSSLEYNNCFITNLYTVYYSNFNNCVLYAYDSTGCPSQVGNYSNFTNCIFANMPNWVGNGLGHLPNYCVYDHCVFSGNNFVAQSGGIGNVMSACVFNAGMPNLFPNTLWQSGVGNVYWNFTQNFHLATASPALTAGIGGMQCGLYGGSNSMKAGLVPTNPHISSATIPNTASNGTLNVTIKARGQ